MKNLPVVILESAVSDLVEISYYIAELSQSLEVGLNFTTRIENKCNDIGYNPYGGAPRPEFGRDVRMMPFEKSGVIFYRASSDVVEVIRIFHGGQNYQEIMTDEGL